MKPSWLRWGPAAAALGVTAWIAVTAFGRIHTAGGSTPPVLAAVPPFTMTDQDGRETSRDSLLGSVVVADFFFATCTNSCPKLAARMGALQQAIDGAERASKRALPIRLVSITLDPENDTPGVLHAYAERVGAEARWSFLTGRSDDLDRVVVDGFHVAFERTKPNQGLATIMHGEYLVLVDPSARIRGYYAAADDERMQALQRDAIDLAAGSREPVGNPVLAASVRDAARGAGFGLLDAGRPVYHATGTIKSFGPGRSYVNIAHDDIAGYMAAMTMSFEPSHPGMLDGLSPGDRVAFEFTEREDAARVIARIEKRP